MDSCRELLRSTKCVGDRYVRSKCLCVYMVFPVLQHEYPAGCFSCYTTHFTQPSRKYTFRLFYSQLSVADQVNLTLMETSLTYFFSRSLFYLHLLTTSTLSHLLLSIILFGSVFTLNSLFLHKSQDSH